LGSRPYLERLDAAGFIDEERRQRVFQQIAFHTLDVFFLTFAFPKVKRDVPSGWIAGEKYPKGAEGSRCTIRSPN
jgi:hypothetical protein